MPILGGKLRKERMTAVGKELAKAEYDVVLLQEVIWFMHTNLMLFIIEILKSLAGWRQINLQFAF